MSARLKRTPLFGQDGHLGIPLVVNNNKNKLQNNPLLKMEVGHTPQNGSYHDPTALPTKRHIHKPPTSNPNTPSKAVNFTINPDGEKKREKYLTAKYGAHQMALIRKRLKVEMWMFDQLQELYESETESSNDVDIDLDEVLDIEDENQRKKFIRDILTDSKSSKEIINKFVDDLLERAKTL
eukprot:GFUD01025984.1.p1 GENE.GFUD01025984.1~~GFUD01025984.1.p1  ORF type:complete len:181 (+),score=47.95 GFUD01025984.1:144-686(+)